MNIKQISLIYNFVNFQEKYLGMIWNEWDFIEYHYDVYKHSIFSHKLHNDGLQLVRHKTNVILLSLSFACCETVFFISNTCSFQSKTGRELLKKISLNNHPLSLIILSIQTHYENQQNNGYIRTVGNVVGSTDRRVLGRTHFLACWRYRQLGGDGACVWIKKVFKGQRKNYMYL